MRIIRGLERFVPSLVDQRRAYHRACSSVWLEGSRMYHAVPRGAGHVLRIVNSLRMALQRQKILAALGGDCGV